MHVNKKLIVEHVQQNITMYLFMSTLLITGIVFGAIIVNSMTFIQKQDLFFHVNQFFNRLNDGEIVVSTDILKKSFTFHIQYLILLFLLGLTIIGIPLIWLLVFVKGLVIGFSVGFIVNQLGLKGLLFVTVSIAPHNVIIIPLYIIASSLANLFSILLLQKIMSRGNTVSIIKPFINYVTAFFLLVAGSFIGSVIETYIAYEAIKISVDTFY